MKPTFQPIRSPRISEEVIAQIKSAILSGRYQPGDKLPSERELIAQFGVGRGVIREALRALEATGFVTMRQGPNGGAYLKELNFNHLTGGFVDLYLAGKLTIPELNQVRRLVEPEVARLAAGRVDEGWRGRLREAMAGERGQCTDGHHRMLVMTRVHFILAEMCGNYLLHAIVNAMIKLTHEIVAAVEPQEHYALHGAGEHDTVAEAVIAGQPQAAAEAMRAHLEQFCAKLVKMDRRYRGQATD
jgi:DNA-binding FadR family transcriptional regulator